MKIAEIANVVESVPPLKYGGTEYVVSIVTEAMVERGHDVTLFASGDSKTKAKLQSVQPRALRSSAAPLFIETMVTRQLLNFAKQADQFELIHNHILQTFAVTENSNVPIVTTLHTDLSRPAEQQVLSLPTAKKTFFISISDAQRKGMPDLPYMKTIYHGLDPSLYNINQEPKEYVVFLGRITPEKGVEYAVEAAQKAGCKLIIAAKVDEPKSQYAQKMLNLFKESKHIDFIGEVGEEKKELLANAKALLMPIQWEEPFGLVVIEALACGTPVIAFKRGSMAEIIIEGETGFLVKDTSEMAEAIKNIQKISRIACRQDIENRFTINQMVNQYERVFEEVIGNNIHKQ